MMPLLRTRLEEAFGAPFGSGLDPMLLVAQGAALFAATAALDARPKTVAAAAGGPRVWLQYPAMTPDTSPFIVGRALDGEAGMKKLRFSRTDGAWQSEWMPFEEDGSFSGMLSLKRRASSSFSVEAELADGRTVATNPAQISVVHGVSIGEPPLARTIGVARADDGVTVYFERGSPLPIRKTFSLRTIEGVSKTATDYALRVPIVQGDFPFAHLCRLVGVIQIPSSALQAALPVGSLIELTLEVDRGGALSAKAFLPAQNLVFEQVEQLLAPATSIIDMTKLVVTLEARAVTLRAQAFREGQRQAVVTLTEFETTLNTARADLDAAEKARRALIDCDGMLGDVEAANAWPELTARVHEQHVNATHWLGLYGSPQEKRSLGLCMDQIERALRARSSAEIERQLRSIHRLTMTAYFRHPEAWTWELDAIANRAATSSDPSAVQALIRRARKAESDSNRAELERNVREARKYFPADEEERTLAFNSGVR